MVFIGHMTDAHLNEDLVNNHQQSFLNVNTQIMFFSKLEFQFNVPWEAWDIFLAPEGLTVWPWPMMPRKMLRA